MNLRPYQAADLDALREAIRAGHRRIVLFAPTGAGKGHCATYLLKSAHEKGKSAAFIVDRLSILGDLSERLDAAGVPHGVIQANHPRNHPQERIQVCSAQTLAFRNLPPCDLILIDECHVTMRAAWDHAMKSGAIVVGLTATPFTAGMDEKFDCIVGSTTTNLLVDQGFLAPVRVFTGKEIDMKGAKTVAGEWSAKEVETRGAKIIGDVVSTWMATWRRHFGQPVKTMVFSASIKHGEELKAEFDRTGYRFEQVSANTPDEVAQRLWREFKNEGSDLIGLISVEKLARGSDAPCVKIGVGCRPYRKSLSAFIQSFGRVMRSHPGKEFAVWIDHAGCVSRFMDDMAELFSDGVHDLKGGSKNVADRVRKEPTEKQKKDVHCVCGAILMPWDRSCPVCGKPREVKRSTHNVDGVMVEVSLARKRNAGTSIGDKAAWYAAFKTYGKNHGHKDGWSANAYRKRFGVFPNDPGIRNAPPGPVFADALNYIKHLNMRYAMGTANRSKKCRNQ